MTIEPPSQESRIWQGTSDENAPDASLGAFGMAVFLVSLSILFAASLVAYVVIRLRAGVWPPPGAPPLPRTLWLSTGILVATSVVVQTALAAVRRNRLGALRAALLGTMALGIGFLVVQSWNWWEIYTAIRHQPAELYSFTFYMLTGLHAAHVFGGLVALTIVLVQAMRRRYDASNYGGVRNCAVYWHFLDVVWIVVFTLLLIGS